MRAPGQGCAPGAAPCFRPYSGPCGLTGPEAGPAYAGHSALKQAGGGRGDRPPPQGWAQLCSETASQAPGWFAVQCLLSVLSEREKQGRGGHWPSRACTCLCEARCRVGWWCTVRGPGSGWGLEPVSSGTPHTAGTVSQVTGAGSARLWAVLVRPVLRVPSPRPGPVASTSSVGVCLDVRREGGCVLSSGQWLQRECLRPQLLTGDPTHTRAGAP